MQKVPSNPFHKFVTMYQLLHFSEILIHTYNVTLSAGLENIEVLSKLRGVMARGVSGRGLFPSRTYL